jgi:hypothetical protein
VLVVAFSRRDRRGVLAQQIHGTSYTNPSLLAVTSGGGTMAFYGLLRPFTAFYALPNAPATPRACPAAGLDGAAAMRSHRPYGAAVAAIAAGPCHVSPVTPDVTDANDPAAEPSSSASPSQVLAAVPRGAEPAPEYICAEFTSGGNSEKFTTNQLHLRIGRLSSHGDPSPAHAGGVSLSTSTEIMRPSASGADFVGRACINAYDT